jgi:hypothetical protein
MQGSAVQRVIHQRPEHRSGRRSGSFRRARNRAGQSGEPKRRMNAFAWRSTLAGTISAVVSSRRERLAAGCSSLAWRRLSPPESAAGGAVLDAIHRDQPARLRVEDMRAGARLRSRCLQRHENLASIAAARSACRVGNVLASKSSSITAIGNAW